MEVCGTHTVSLFRHGIRSLLPPAVTLVSGPGCPVCVTDQGQVDAFVALSREPNVILATFGDLVRVPGSGSSLSAERARGRDVRVVYSASDAVALARANPDKRVVFPAVGFETTAPTTAAALLAARAEGLSNFFLFSAHKLVPPALSALLESPGFAVDGFLLPGHVCVVTGADAFRPLAAQYRVPCVAAGFEPVDMLLAILLLVRQANEKRHEVENAYPRAVSNNGNPTARAVMERVFAPRDEPWRGLGNIPLSGLALSAEFSAHDAERAFSISARPAPPPPGCLCGAVLTGAITPPRCPLFRKTCTPSDPVGPCMVSSEGTCAAFYKYA